MPPKCEHPELYKSICLSCDHKLTYIEKFGRGDEDDANYREYALLGRGRDMLIKQDVAP